MKKALFASWLLLSLFALSQAQISINGSLPKNYTQNFDILGTNNVNWANESSILGWLFVVSTNGVDNGPITTLYPSDGGSMTLALGYTLGTTANLDRSLGSRSLTFGDVYELFYGARFINNTLGTITNVSISYAGEQWRDADNNAQTIAFYYRIDGSNFLGDPSNTGWTAASSLDFISPQNTGLNIALDGNNPTNRIVISDDIQVTLAPGQEFWIRWADTANTPSNDHILGIDDLVISFDGINPVPPPNLPPVLEGVTIELKKPKIGKRLKFKGSKGFKVKGLITSASNTVSQASYAAFGGTNTPTNLTFIDAGKFKLLTKGKLFKKGVDATFKSTKTTKAGAGITETPVTFLVRIFGGSNNASQVTFTNIFTDVKIKQ